MGFFLDYLLVSSVFVIKLIPLRELLFGFLRLGSKIGWIRLSLFLVRAVFLEFEFLLNVLEVFLVHL